MKPHRYTLDLSEPDEHPNTMAKVVLPLLSAEARGKIADALVFFPLAHAVGGQPVRRWLTPANPQSAAQGDSRIRTAAVGNITSLVTADKDLRVQIKAMMPAKKIWNAYYVERMTGSAFSVINAALTAYDGIATATQSLWEASATSLAIEDTVLSYSTLVTITGAMKLYVAANAAYLMGLTCAGTAAVDMVEADITGFAAAFTGVA